MSHFLIFGEAGFLWVSCFVASCRHKRAEESSDHRSAPVSPVLFTTLCLCIFTAFDAAEEFKNRSLHYKQKKTHCESRSFTSATLYWPWNGCLQQRKRSNVDDTTIKCQRNHQIPSPSHLPRGDGGHGGVLVVVPHSVVVGNLPGGDERSAVISQQPLVIWTEDNKQSNWIYLYKVNYVCWEWWFLRRWQTL